MPNLTGDAKALLDIISKTKDAKRIRDDKNLAIQRLIEDGFSVATRKGARKIDSKMISQAILKVINRMKPLDFRIHGAGRPEWMESLVTAAVSMVMDIGGFISALRDKQGAFHRLLAYGDGLVLLGANPDTKGLSPIVFTTISQENFYPAPLATTMRGQWGNRCTRAAAVFSYDLSEAMSLYPQMSDDTVGRIPRDINSLNEKDLDRTLEQTRDSEKDLVEVAHYWDIESKSYSVFAGRQMEELESFSGDSYPFTYETADGREEAYIPVMALPGIPSLEGFWNHGIGETLFDLAILSRQLTNMGANHALDTSDPLWNFSLPKGEASKFFEKMRAAQEMRAQGKKGFITTEYDPNSPGSNQVGLTSLIAPSNYNEMAGMFERLDRELKRFGINLDESDMTNPNMTATQVMALEESSSSFVKQLMEFGASEYKFAVEVTMEMIKRFVPKSDKTPLNLTTKIDTGEVQFRPDEITLGMVADELRKYQYFVKVNSRSGSIPSNAMKLAQVNSVLQLAQPGSPAWVKGVTQYASLNDMEMQGEDFMPEQGMAGSTEEATGLPAPETSRMTINPRMKQVPTF